MYTRTAICRIDGTFQRVNDNGEDFLDALVNPTKAGVFLYLNADGTTRRELRPRAEVFKPESLATLENKPHTDSHPPEFVTSKNHSRYTTGHVYGKHEPAPDGIHTQARVRVNDAQAIQNIEANGKTQVSCGYTCDLIEKSGMDPEFGRYDAIQTNIKYNHLASVDRGRAGPGARLRADHSDLRFDAIEINENNINFEEIPKMVKITIDGHEVEVSEAAKVAIQAQQQKHNDQLEAETKRADKAQADLKAAKSEKVDMQAKLDEAIEKVDRANSVDVDQLINKRLNLREDAKRVLGNDFKFDGLNEQQIKEAVILKARPNVKLDRIDEIDRPVYVNGRFDAVIEDIKSQTNDPLSRYDSFGAGQQPREDGINMDQDPLEV